MPYFTLHRTLAVINLSILLILAGDTYLLPHTHTRQIYDRRYTVDAKASYGTTRRYSTDYIVTKSGEEIQVPHAWQFTNIGLNDNDTFYLDKSFLFRQQQALFFHWHSGIAKMSLSVLDDNIYGTVMAVFILIASLLYLLPWTLIKNKNWNERLIFFASAVTILLTFYYFFY